jgi:hypothetical protein
VNITGDKKQIKRRWRKHFEETINKNTHKNTTAALALEPNTQKVGKWEDINTARNPAAHTEIRQ